MSYDSCRFGRRNVLGNYLNLSIKGEIDIIHYSVRIFLSMSCDAPSMIDLPKQESVVCIQGKMNEKAINYSLKSK
jgi:hypothetical protein